MKTLSNSNYTQGIVSYIKLNFYEIECIEIALQSFYEKLKQNNLPALLIGLGDHHLQYLSAWLNKPMLKNQLRFDGSNSVVWPFTSSELVDWLVLVCAYCVDEDAIFMASAHAASCETSAYTDIYLDHCIPYSEDDDATYQHYSRFRHYYDEIITTYHEKLVKKLFAIQQQNYPLCSDFSTQPLSATA